MSTSKIRCANSAQCDHDIDDVEVAVHIKRKRSVSGDGYSYSRWVDTDAGLFCSVECVVNFYADQDTP